MGRKGLTNSKIWDAFVNHAVEVILNPPIPTGVVSYTFNRAGTYGTGVVVAGSTFMWIASKDVVARFRQYGSMGYHQSQDNLAKYIKWTPALPIMSGIIIVAGDEELRDTRCWEDVIGINNVNKLDREAKARCEEYGMIFQDVATFCTPVEVRENGVLLVKNYLGEYYAFVTTAESRADPSKKAPNDKIDVQVVHAVRVQVEN